MLLVNVVLLALSSSLPETRLVIAPTAGHRLGETVNISGSTIVCGSPGDDEKGTASGSVNVFVDRVLQKTIYAPTPQLNDALGGVVSVDGDKMAWGTPHHTNNSGIVGVVTRTAGAWSGSTVLTLDLRSADDRFGAAVALWGDWLAVGAPRADKRAVYLFKRNGLLWTLQQTIKSTVFYDDSQYGSALAMANGWLVIGEPDRDWRVTDDGAVYVYKLAASGLTWTSALTLSATAADAVDYLRFGTAVATDGQTIVVGAPNPWNLGKVYTYTYDGTSWTGGTLTAPDGATGDQFGASVDVDGRMIVVGAPYDDGVRTDEGSAYVFVNGVFRHKLGTGPVAGDKFGTAVAVEGSTVVIGVPYADMAGLDAGAACIFTIPPEAASLVFTTQPTSIYTGDATTPAVTVYDQYEQVFTTPVSVTIGLSNNPNGASLIGTTTVTTSGGVASYSLGVSLERIGYVLEASVSSLSTSTRSLAFDVRDPAAKFVILNPIDGTVDGAITITVQAQTAAGAVMPTYQTDVTLVASGSATEGLVSIVNGQGTIRIFNTVAETVNLTLQDTQSSGLDVSSTQDVVFHVGTATTLIFGEQPSDVEVGAAVTPSIVISITDRYGNLRLDTGVSITLSIGPRSNGEVYPETWVIATVGGDAVFSDVRFTRAGDGYTLVASRSGLMGAVSEPFAVVEASSKGCGGGAESIWLGWLLPFAVALAVWRR